jgi:hypothetical protein
MKNALILAVVIVIFCNYSEARDLAGAASAYYNQLKNISTYACLGGMTLGGLIMGVGLKAVGKSVFLGALSGFVITILAPAINTFFRGIG